MFSFSNFEDKKCKFSNFSVPRSESYKVYINGKEIPVYTCRISSYGFNRWWPKHQRPVTQSEIISYINLVSNEEIKIEIESLSKTTQDRVMLKPYSKCVKLEKKDNKYVFTLRENGAYIFEINDYHDCLYIFNNKPIICDNTKEDIAYYFGAGVHFTGTIKLHSNDSVYIDKDAIVYGNIFAENAKNIHIFGNGIFDDSGEERFCPNCMDEMTIGNIKFYDCKDIKIEGVGFTNSAVWCVNLFHCFNVKIDGINVFGQWRYNTDGIDIVNCQNILINNSFVHSFDDTITIKGIEQYAKTSNVDIKVNNCVLWCDWGKTCELGLETACKEYKDIVFSNCDIVHAASAACDIQNGHWAEIHNITFKNLSIELESFYKMWTIQKSDDDVYDEKNCPFELTCLLFVVNIPMEQYDYGAKISRELNNETTPPCWEKYASVHDVLMKDINVFCDEKLFESLGTKCVSIWVENHYQKAEFANIKVENILLNGKKLSKADMKLTGYDSVSNFEIK